MKLSNLIGCSWNDNELQVKLILKFELNYGDKLDAKPMVKLTEGGQHNKSGTRENTNQFSLNSLT